MEVYEFFFFFKNFVLFFTAHMFSIRDLNLLSAMLVVLFYGAINYECNVSNRSRLTFPF